MWNYFLFKASVGVRKKLISWPKILPEFHIHMPELFDFEFGSSWTYVLMALLTFSTRSKRRLFTVQLLSNYVVPYSCRSGLHLQFKSESVPHFRDAHNTITDLLTSIWLLCSLFAVKLPIKTISFLQWIHLFFPLSNIISLWVPCCLLLFRFWIPWPTLLDASAKRLSWSY